MPDMFILSFRFIVLKFSAKKPFEISVDKCLVVLYFQSLYSRVILWRHRFDFIRVSRSKDAIKKMLKFVIIQVGAIFILKL